MIQIQNKKIRLLWYFLLAFFIFELDRTTKQIAVHYATESYYVNSFLSFDLVINRGVTNGLFYTESQTWFMVLNGVITCIIILLAFFAIERWRRNKFILGHVLVLAGAISNLLDRLTFDGVVDFIHISFNGWSFPIFNIADICIVIGVIIMLITHLRES